jgi:hypothetical protein
VQTVRSELNRRRSGLPLRQRRVRFVLVGRLDFDPDTVLQGELVANEHIPLSLSCSGHEEDAWFLAGRDEAMGDAGRAVHEVPSLEVVLLAFDDCDALTGEDEEVLLVVELAMVLRPALAWLEYGQVVPELREPVATVLEHAQLATDFRRHRGSSGALISTGDDVMTHPKKKAPNSGPS